MIRQPIPPYYSPHLITYSTPEKSKAPSSSPQGTTQITPERNPFIHSMIAFLRSPPSPERNSQGHSKVKTIFCDLHLWNRCQRTNCDYAHDESELQAVPVPDNYKTMRCRQEQTLGTCSYHFNCSYIHYHDWIERCNDIVVMRTPHPFFPHLLVIYKIGKRSS